MSNGSSYFSHVTTMREPWGGGGGGERKEEGERYQHLT